MPPSWDEGWGGVWRGDQSGGGGTVSWKAMSKYVRDERWQGMGEGEGVVWLVRENKSPTGLGCCSCPAALPSLICLSCFAVRSKPIAFNFFFSPFLSSSSSSFIMATLIACYSTHSNHYIISNPLPLWEICD